MLNQHHPSIRLKTTTSFIVVEFLDTSIFKKEKFENSHRLDIKVFFKVSDAHAVLYKPF